MFIEGYADLNEGFRKSTVSSGKCHYMIQVLEDDSNFFVLTMMEYTGIEVDFHNRDNIVDLNRLFLSDPVKEYTVELYMYESENCLHDAIMEIAYQFTEESVTKIFDSLGIDFSGSEIDSFFMEESTFPVPKVNGKSENKAFLSLKRSVREFAQRAMNKLPEGSFVSFVSSRELKCDKYNLLLLNYVTDVLTDKVIMYEFPDDHYNDEFTAYAIFKPIGSMEQVTFDVFDNRPDIYLSETGELVYLISSGMGKDKKKTYHVSVGKSKLLNSFNEDQVVFHKYNHNPHYHTDHLEGKHLLMYLGKSYAVRKNNPDTPTRRSDVVRRKYQK
jgi:hypothetical protein